jgi:DNA polymerase III epsilon subunit-like protein
MEKNNKSLTNKIANKGDALKYINKYKTKNDLILKNINELNTTKDIINNYLLYNILSDELLKIESDYDKISQMIKYLIEYKYKHNITKSDNDFINNYLEVSSKYFNDIVIDKSKSEDITKDVQIIKSDKIILDIETDGFDNIIQVAYKMYDTDMKVIKIKNIYINDGIHFTDYYKRISYETIVSKGITPKEASKILYNDINNTNILIGHNIKSFDYEKIKNYINRYYNDKFKDTIIFHDTCTNDKICSIVGAKNKNNRIKKPRLEELYKFLFPDENIITDSTHTADYDVEITEKCYNKIQSYYKLF